MSREKTRLFCPGTSDLNGTGKGLMHILNNVVVDGGGGGGSGAAAGGGGSGSGGEVF